MKKISNSYLLGLIMRQYPLWPSTFGPCCNEGDGQAHVSARGGGYCLYCLHRELERRIGKDGRIYDFCQGLEDNVKTYHELLRRMEELPELEDGE